MDRKWSFFLWQTSKEQREFAKWRCCPRCDRFIFGFVRHLDGTGQRISPLFLNRHDTLVQCPKCLGTWNMWRQVQSSEQASPWTLQAMVETERFEEPLGDDERVIDASRTKTAITRNLTFTKEWSRSLTLEMEKSITNTLGTSLGLDAVSIHTSAEEAVRHKYGISSTDREAHTEEVTIVTPGGTRQRVVLEWKRVWQRGIVKIVGGSGQMVSIPYSVAVGVTFDQKVIDEAV